MSPDPGTVLVVDGNSLLHRAFHASARSGFRDAAGRPAWAVRGLLSQLVAAVDRAMADAVVVGFDDPAASVRRANSVSAGPFGKLLYRSSLPT